MNRDEVRTVVFRHLHEMVPGTSERVIDEHAPLNEIGVDSLDLVDVASRSMQELSVKLPRAAIGRIRTMDDLIQVLLETVQAAQAAAEPDEPILLQSPESADERAAG